MTTLAQDLLTQMEPIFPGITKQWNGKAMLSTSFTDPNFLCGGAAFHEALEVLRAMLAGEVHVPLPRLFVAAEAGVLARFPVGVASEVLADLKKM